RAREYTPDARSLISRITDTATGEWHFSHDERERLAATAFTPHRVDGLMSWQESFTHDAAGNLTGPLTVTSGNRLTRAGNTRYEYDGYGNRILEVTGSEEHHYTWDTQHRLTGYRCRVRGQETAHYRYQYDALGRRILKEDLLASTARRFFWQGERLLGERDAGRFWPGRLPDNPQLQEALRDASCRVWLYEDEHDFRPLLMLCGREANAGVYHYVCDHLGTPLELRDVRGGVVWSAMLRSYGQVHHADTAGINQPLRFQGQYHDAESGLYYNRHRYYDPGVGRYLSPDPVGLDGGLNLYAYVPDPLGWVDPLGLTACPKNVKTLLEGPQGTVITVKSKQEAHDLLMEVFPDAQKVRGIGSQDATGIRKKHKMEQFKKRDGTVRYRKDYPIDSNTGRVYGHDDPKGTGHGSLPHINIKRSDGTMVRIDIDG
ncbi:TPA: RHS domain-containing protein, partial [Enterobacter asburiae]|nr:RHS domain-containing protein [Enterobacter asburiae]